MQKTEARFAVCGWPSLTLGPGDSPVSWMHRVEPCPKAPALDWLGQKTPPASVFEALPVVSGLSVTASGAWKPARFGEQSFDVCFVPTGVHALPAFLPYVHVGDPPTHFGHGLICNALFPWLSGCDLFIMPPFRPETIARLGTIIDENRITFMSSVPALWRLALRIAKPPGLHALSRVFVGSAPLSAALWNDIAAWAGSARVMNAYGITETGSWLAGTTVGDFTPEDGLIGVPWGGVIAVLNSRDPAVALDRDAVCAPGESGHVWTLTPALMRGYLDRDDLTAQVVSHGWFATGDIGVIDDRGWLVLRGREREEINKGGMKVYPGDIDGVIERFAATLDVCSFAYADPLLGEDVGVAVALKQHDDSTLRDLHQWARQHLAAHQLPQRWYVLEEIPRTSRGKVNRAQIAEHCVGRQPVDMASIMRGSLPREGS